MQNINLDDFLTEGIIKEKILEKSIPDKLEKVSRSKVIIKGCSKAAVPTWAYLIITANLTKYAKRIYFGEPCSAISIYKK